VGAELGADIVKVNYPGSPDSFQEVVAGCPVPVVIAGGEKLESDADLLQMVADSVAAGGAGASIGRNAFQHADPEGMVRAISMVVHEGASVAAAKHFLESRR
jgi:class I fructose-bisphosphate aldolase